MATVNVYKDAYSDRYDTIYCDDGLTVGQVLGDGFDYENSVVMCNGKKVGSDYALKSGDIVCARTFPGVITAAVVAVAGFVKFASSGFDGNYWQNGVLAVLADWLKPDKSDTSGNSGSTSEAEKIPSIKGGRNQSAQGHPVPIVLGKSVLTPYYCGLPYTTIGGDDGDTQYLNVCYQIAYDPIEVTGIKLGELILSENSGKVSNGTIPVSSAEGSAGRFVGNVELEIRSGSSASPALYPKKVVQESLNFQLLYPAPKDENSAAVPLKAERFSAAHPHKIEVEISLNALLSQDDSGNLQDATCKVLLGISLDGGATYSPFGAFAGANSSSEQTITNTAGQAIGTGTESVITRKKNKGMRFVATRELTWQEAVYLHEHGGDVAQIFIQKNNTDPLDNKTQDKVYCSGIRTWTYDYSASTEAGGFVDTEPVSDPKLRESIVCLAMRVRADNGFSDLNGTLNQLSCIVQSKCRTWNGSSWSQSLSPSSNPAAVSLGLMQSKSLGQYAIPDTRIDLQRLGELYDFCEQHTGKSAGSQTARNIPLRVGGVLTSQKKLFETLNLVLSAGRSCICLNGGKYSVLVDKPRDVPVTVLNNHSFLADGLSNSKSFDELPDGYKVKFINERLGYSEDAIYVMVGDKTSSDPTAVIEATEMTWVTNPDLVWQATVYNHAKRKLRSETWNRKLGIDGGLIEVGSLVEIQDDTIVVGIGDGAEVRSVVTSGGQITAVTVDGPFYVSDTGERYGVKIVVADGVNPVSVIKREVSIPRAGDYDTLVFTEPLPAGAIVPGSILSFGVLGKITTDAICTGKKDNGDWTFDMTFVPYDERVYTADIDGIPEFSSNVTNPQTIEEVSQIPQDYVRSADFNTALGMLVSGNDESIGSPGTVRSLSAEAVRDGISLSWLPPSGGGLAHTMSYYLIEFSADGGETYSEVTKVSATEFLYPFIRSVHGYPERTAFSSWRFRVSAVNIYGQNGEPADTVVGTTTYGTWTVGNPVITSKVVDRTVILQMSMANPQNREIYGNIRYHVRVRRGEIPGYHSIKYWMHDTDGDEFWYRVSDDGKLNESTTKDLGWTLGTAAGYEEDSPKPFESSSDGDTAHEYSYLVVERTVNGDTVWQKPTVTKDPYANHGNYYDADSGAQDGRFVVSDGTYTQTMPLWFDEGTVHNLMNTPYWFDVRCVNEAGAGDWYSGASDWSTGHDGYLVVALCTNLRDIVRANETAKQAYIEELSAITANLGEISQGSFSGGDTNFWTLTTKNNAQPSEQDPNNRAFQGAFMVGDGNQYFRSKPIVELRNGRYVITGYELSLKAANISFSSSGDVELGDVDLKNGTYIYDERNPSIRLGLSANGISIQRKTSPAGGWDSGNVTEVGVVRLTAKTDAQGHVHTSFIVTDDPANVPEGIIVPGATVYHMSGSVTDEDGQDPANLSLDAAKLTDGDSHIRSSCGSGSYRGDVTVASPGQSCVVLTRMDSIYVNGYRVGADGTVVETTKSVLDGWNHPNPVVRTGLSTEQLANNIFKLEEEEEE